VARVWMLACLALLVRSSCGFQIQQLASHSRLSLARSCVTTFSNMPGCSPANRLGLDASVCKLYPHTSTSLQASTDTLPPTAVKSIEKKTLKKLLPLGLMLFFILFNYTILRDTKDVLVVTAPNSGAEIIPFLKTYVNLPSAIGFTLLYSALCNKMSPDKVFYFVMTAFIAFFGAFAGFICKYRIKQELLSC
jgi:hypothetical protein